MKTRRRKIICVFVCILLCASFFVFPVSAEDTEYYQRGEIRPDSWNQVSIDDFAFGFDEVYSGDLFNSIDRRNWQQMLDRVTLADKTMTVFPWDLNTDDVVSVVQYDVSDFDEILKIGHYWGSFMFRNAPILNSNTPLSDSLQIKLNFARFEYLMRGMLIPRRIRFSLRESLGDGNFSKPVCATRTFDAGSANLESFSNIVYDEYGNYVSLLSFDRIIDNAYSGGDLYLCIDFDLTFRPGITSQEWDGKFSLGLKDDLLIVVSRYSSDAGSSGIYYPELDNPWYKQPDLDYFSDLLESNSNIISSHKDGQAALGAYFRDFKDVFSEYSGGLQNVAVLMNELLISIPGFEGVLVVSITLGMFAFILGLSGSIIGSLGHRISSRRSNHSNDSKSSVK